jgi:ABC-type transport system involved in multi-copper enzyme maturation permease subunit
MLNKMRIIAWNTFIEARRDKILGILFVFTVVLICSSTALGELAIGEDRGTKVIRDFSVSAISLMCLLITIFLGTSIVSKEVEKRTIYTILSKHCTRSTFICGKFLGLITTYTICMLGMAVISALVYRFYGGEFQPSLLLILLGLFLELLFLNAIALFFAVAFTSPILAAVLTFVFMFVVMQLS